MKELKNDIYDNETFFLSVDPEIIIQDKWNFIAFSYEKNTDIIHCIVNNEIYTSPVRHKESFIKYIDKFIGKG